MQLIICAVEQILLFWIDSSERFVTLIRYQLYRLHIISYLIHCWRIHTHTHINIKQWMWNYFFISEQLKWLHVSFYFHCVSTTNDSFESNTRNLTNRPSIRRKGNIHFMFRCDAQHYRHTVHLYSSTIHQQNEYEANHQVNKW